MSKNYLTNLMKGVNGCSAILVYNMNHKENNHIYRVGELNDSETNAIKQNIGVFNSSMERAEKLCKTSSAKTIMAFYNNHQLLIFSKSGIVFIVVATPEANAGSLLNLKTELEPLVPMMLSNNSLGASDGTVSTGTSLGGTASSLGGLLHQSSSRRN